MWCCSVYWCNWWGEDRERGGGGGGGGEGGQRSASACVCVCVCFVGGVIEGLCHGAIVMSSHQSENFSLRKLQNYLEGLCENYNMHNLPAR